MQEVQSGGYREQTLVFRSKMTSADYHDEMSSKHFMECFTEQLATAKNTFELGYNSGKH